MGRPIKTEADANRFIRDGIRQTLTDRADEWRPLWVRDGGDGTWRIERHYGGDPELTIDMRVIPAEARPTVEALLTLLAEQAWCARLAGVLAQSEIGRAAGGKRGSDKTARTNQQDAAERDRAIVRTARAILRDHPDMTDKALARTLEDRGHGGFEALRKKLPGLLRPKK